jgi:GNAT superfamily N-acetyltransferase
MMGAPPCIRVRRARPGEAAVLTALNHRSKAVWGYDDDFMRRAARDLTLTPSDIRCGRVFVAVCGGGLCGVLALSPPGDPPELNQLFVAPEWMRRGVGERLMRHALRVARRWGWRAFAIASDPDAVAFYARMGAQPVGEVPSIVGGGRMLPLLRMPVRRR